MCFGNNFTTAFFKKKDSDRLHCGHQDMKLQKVGKLAGGFIDRLNTFLCFFAFSNLFYNLQCPRSISRGFRDFLS